MLNVTKLLYAFKIILMTPYFKYCVNIHAHAHMLTLQFKKIKCYMQQVSY